MRICLRPGNTVSKVVKIGGREYGKLPWAKNTSVRLLRRRDGQRDLVSECQRSVFRALIPPVALRPSYGPHSIRNAVDHNIVAPSHLVYGARSRIDC